MRSILEEFALGNISTGSHFFSPNSHYGKTLKRLSESEKKLFDILNEHDKETLEILSESQLELNALSNTDRFVHGYRLGVLMTMEVFNGKESLVVGGD